MLFEFDEYVYFVYILKKYKNPLTKKNIDYFLSYTYNKAYFRNL